MKDPGGYIETMRL